MKGAESAQQDPQRPRNEMLMELLEGTKEDNILPNYGSLFALLADKMCVFVTKNRIGLL